MSFKVLVVGKGQDSLMEIIYRVKMNNACMVSGCSSFVKAIKLLENEKFDIVFIDTDFICTHVNWGIKIIHERFEDIKIILISSTADYLDLAFDTHTIGYILKPVCDRKVLNSIERVEKLKPVTGFKGVIVKHEDKDIFLSYNEIIFIEAANRRSIVHTLKHEYPMYRSIKDFLKELPSDTFVQSHRSFIINTTKIKFIKQFNKTSYNVTFSNGKFALLSRKHIKELRVKCNSFNT